MKSAAQGWYQDNLNPGRLRWWDGQQWTNKTRPVSFSSDWRAWITHSRTATKISVCIAALASTAATISASVVVAALVRDRPIHGSPLLVVLGMPLFVVGQLWMMGLINARGPVRHRKQQARKQTAFVQPSELPSPRQLLFPDLSPNLAAMVLALALLGVLAAVTSFPHNAAGAPVGGSTSCPYRLNNRGHYTCVAKDVYDQARVNDQRAPAGVLFAFFTVHAGVAFGRVRARAGVTRRS